jgi:ABC-type multidrug transport system fused ATPase/permease subunit
VKSLLTYVRPHRRALILGVVLGLLANASALAEPLVARDVIDSLGDEGRSSLQPVLLLSGLVVVSGLLGGVQLWMLDRVAERIALAARLALASRMLRLRLSELDQRPLGDLLSRVTSDTTLLRAATTTGIVESFNGALALVGAVVLMGVLDLALLLVTAGVLAVVAVGVLYVLPRIARATKRAQAAVGKVGSALERALGAIRTVKASGAEEREFAVVTAAATEAYDQGVAIARYSALVGVSSGFAVQLTFLAVLGVGGARVAAGSLDVATLIAFLLYLFYLVGPITALTVGATQLQAGLAAVSRIAEIDALEIEQDALIPTARAKPEASSPRGRPVVRFDRVSFAYRPDQPVLREVSFSVAPASQTAIVGPSGAGKTTLFALLERFYDPGDGTIVLFDTPLRDIPRAELRARIGYVEQESPVLAGTLRENLLYAAPEASDEALADVIEEARLAEMLLRLPDGLDTEVGDRGATLSGGERQRIAIARALLRRPDLLLLDEATAQLDAANEHALRETIERAARRCAVLVIAHRLSTVVAAHQIIVLEHGRVRAIGSHVELIGSDSLYRELAATQLIATT